MWLQEIERWTIAALETLWLAAEHLRDFCWGLAAIWDRDAEGSWPWKEQAAMVETTEIGAAVPASRVLASPRRTYVLESKIAAGDLCDVHFAESEGDGFLIKTPRVPGAAAERLMRKEMRILQRLTDADEAPHHRLYFPQPVESVAAGDRLCSVFRWADGYYTAGEIAMRTPSGVDGRHVAWMFKRILEALGCVHRRGWIHGAVLPPHLLFHAENHGLNLCGWIHAVRPGEPLTLVPAEFKSWYPLEARHGAECETDLYLAAKSMIYLAGGDPLRDEFPDHIPRPMQHFLQACLLESPRMRPSDAWELHEEFDRLLAQLYGPPQYVRLPM